MLTRVLGSLAVLVCVGCGGARDVVPEPNAITLRDALVDTVRALNAAFQEARQPGNQIMGYYPCTLTANYNISATGTTGHKIGLAVGGGAPGGVTISANASREDSLTGARGNQVQVTFATSLCLPAAPVARAAPAGRVGAARPANSTGGQPPPVEGGASGTPGPGSSGGHSATGPTDPPVIFMNPTFRAMDITPPPQLR